MIGVMPDLSEILILLSNNALPLAIGLLFLVVLLVLITYFQKQEAQVNAQNKSYEIIHNAIKKAQEIISGSELEGIKITADQKLTLKKLEQQSEQSLRDSALDAKTYIEKAQSTFTDYLMQLSQEANVSVSESEKVVKERINKLFEEFEQHLSSYLTQTQQESIRAINLEVASARQLIETYKTEQFRLVDENIVAMLERTLSLVLVKKLTLKEHVELVYESLEKAKAEKFII